MGGQEPNPYLVSYPSMNCRPQSPFASAASASLYPKIPSEGPQPSRNPTVDVAGDSARSHPYPQIHSQVQQPTGNPYILPMSDCSANAQNSGFEELLVTISGAIVHLVDDQESVFLDHGNFTVSRIKQHDQGIVAVVRVGDGLQWPLMSDEQVVKLDSIHYVFSLPVIDKDTAEAQGGENMHYGVTFSIPGQEAALRTLDEVLECYSLFYLPTLVHGDQIKQAADAGLAPNAASQLDTMGAAVVPESVVAGDPKQITEENQKVFWTEMAPNVDDYRNRVAKSVASGSGHLIRGIFWVRDSTVERLQSGAINKIKNSKPADKPTNIRPSTLRNLQRVKSLTKATDNFAKSVLSGIISVAGTVPNAIVKSRVGRAFFRTGPGEVALASMISFWKVCDAVEQATKEVLKSGTNAASKVVTHRRGHSAGKATEEVLGSAGHLVGAAWSAVKIPKALNPTAVLKPNSAAVIGMHQTGPTQPR